LADRTKKAEIITFKVDPALAEALRKVPNRSEFIRNAVARAFDHVCPVCGGTGVLDESQAQHWDSFSKQHRVEKCADCHAVHLVCLNDSPTRGPSNSDEATL